jgi:hypothetical protein
MWVSVEKYIWLLCKKAPFTCYDSIILPFGSHVKKKMVVLWKIARGIGLTCKGGGNRSRAVRILGISRVTVWNRVRKYGINPKRVLTP